VLAPVDLGTALLAPCAAGTYWVCPYSVVTAWEGMGGTVRSMSYPSAGDASTADDLMERERVPLSLFNV
jgi:hypothetical protein